MKLLVLLVIFFVHSASLFAQKKEEGFNYAFKPTQHAPRYYVITEKSESLWTRTAFYLPERTQAMECSYRDAEAQIPHGTEKWFFPNKVLKWIGNYADGKKEGVWVTYDSAGRLRDSSDYAAGKRKGVQLYWHINGYMSDSSYFDGAGNGTTYQWSAEGTISATGRWIRDTSKQGKWTYFNASGGVRVTETYDGGTLLSRTCFNEAGTPQDSANCVEQEAIIKGGITAWKRYLQRTLRPDVPLKNGAPRGVYEVAVQFVVDSKGTVTDINPMTRFGFGMEEEAVRVIKNSPAWIPAEQFGKKVKAYRIQPLTFMVD